MHAAMYMKYPLFNSCCEYNIIVFLFFVFCFCFFKGGTILGSPDEVLDLGDTEVTQDVFMDFLSGIEQQNFRSAI